MGERDVVVRDVVEEVDLLLFGEECSTDAVHRGVAPALVVEAALLVEEVEELRVCLAAPEVKVANLEIAPDYTEGPGGDESDESCGKDTLGGTYNGSGCSARLRRRR